MNLLDERLSLSKNDPDSIFEGEFKINQEEQKIEAKDSKNDLLRIKEKNINIINNNTSNHCKDTIISYYDTTHQYLLNSKELSEIFKINKDSRNFVRKNILINNIFRNELEKNYNDNYINNYEQIDNYIYGNNNKYLLKNNIDNKRLNNCFGNNLYLCSKVANFNHSNIYKNYASNNFCDNKLDCPPFIPSNYKKKEDEKFIRKKSEDSISKDKESDSTSAISEKKEDEIITDIMKNPSKKNNNEKIDKEVYLVEMFGRKGWICKLCNNFNYETRVKCNRCGIIKKPKRLMEIKQKNDEEHNKEGDWKCIHCKNLNYSFRKLCNRCKLPKMIPYINNRNNQMVNQFNLPIFQVSPSLFCYNNGQLMLCNNY